MPASTPAAAGDPGSTPGQPAGSPEALDSSEGGLGPTQDGDADTPADPVSETDPASETGPSPQPEGDGNGLSGAEIAGLAGLAGAGLADGAAAASAQPDPAGPPVEPADESAAPDQPTEAEIALAGTGDPVDEQPSQAQVAGAMLDSGDVAGATAQAQAAYESDPQQFAEDAPALADQAAEQGLDLSIGDGGQVSMAPTDPVDGAGGATVGPADDVAPGIEEQPAGQVGPDQWGDQPVHNLPIYEAGKGPDSLWAPPTDVPTEELSHGDPGREVANGDLPRFGVEPTLAKVIQDKLSDMPEGAYMDIKPGSEDAMDQRMKGAIGKVEMIKPKSIRENEWMIGMGTRGDEGLTAFAEPKLLERPEGMSDEDWSDRQAVKPDGVSDEEWDALKPQLQQYIDQRQKDYNGYSEAMDRAGTTPFTAWIDGNQRNVLANVSDGTVGWSSVAGYERLGPGVQYLTDADSGEMVGPVSGDVDGFSVYNPAWGEPGSDGYKSNELQFWNELARDSGGRFQHDGNTVAWEAPSPKLEGIRADILNEYAENNPNGRNVLRLTSEGAYTARGPAVTPDGTVLNGPWAKG